MGITVASLQLRLPKRSSKSDASAERQRSISDSTSYTFGRSMSALARHRPHELSEIREVSGSSKATLARRYSATWFDGNDATVEAQPTAEHGHGYPEHPDPMHEPATANMVHPVRPITPRSDLRSLAPSALSLPLTEIPLRRSSMSALSQIFPKSRKASLQDLRFEGRDPVKYMVNQGHAESPLRHAIEKGALSSELSHVAPSRTFIRTVPPFYLLDDHQSRNGRLEMSIRLPAPLFVGGGTAEGQIELRIDLNSSKKVLSKPLLISRLSVDIIGIEEVEDGRRRIFLSLATELFDSQHPPPSTMVSSQIPEKGSELYWQTRPSTVTVPFCVYLPLKLGPPPYSSRQASIRYLLCPSAIIKIGEKRCAVRQAWSIQMLTIHNPEKALASLPSPLLASDTLTLSYRPVVQSVKLTAGLHRQTWVGGGAIFIDIHVVNRTDKTLKKIELQLEKSVLWFSHSIAGTVEKRAANLRLPSKIVTEVVCKNTIKKTKEWEGIGPQGSEIRTCEIEIPKGHTTIGDGRYFEVRYFVKVTALMQRNKTVSVQLPVTIIPINSLDIMPNSLPQVAVSIEAKRSMAISALGNSIAKLPYSQGKAFADAHSKSADRVKHMRESLNLEDINSLIREVDDSPRRMENNGGVPQSCVSQLKSDRLDENVPLGPSPCYRHLTLRPSCYHCHLLFAEHATKIERRNGPKLPRLQVSTSGLGFSESEFEIPPDPVRKVMLSEKERKMINQQRELNLQREWSQQKRRGRTVQNQEEAGSFGATRWTNMPTKRHILSQAQYADEIGEVNASKQSSHRQDKPIHAKRSSFPPAKPRRGRTEANSNMRASFSEGDSRITSKDRPFRGIRSMEEGNRHRLSGCNLVDNDVFAPLKIDSTVPQGNSGV